MISVVVLFAFIMSASATVFIEGPCPNVKPVDYLNITAYGQGTWFEVIRYPNDFENRGECVSIEFKPEGGVYKFKLSDIVDSKRDYLEGYVEYAANAGTTGLVNWCSSAFKASEGINVVPVYVIGIDYDKFSIGYECKYDEKKNLRHDYAWVLSRTKTLDAETKAVVDKILGSSSFIDMTKFLQIHYTPDACKFKA